MIRDCAVIPNGKEDDLDYLRAAVSLAGIWAIAGLTLTEPLPSPALAQVEGGASE